MTEAESLLEDQKKWIDEASFYELLTLWRGAPVGEPKFQGEAGDYYARVMAKKKDALEPGEAVRISKEVGW